MKKTFLKTIGGAALALLMLVMFAQIQVSAQQEPPEDATKRNLAQALEGSWSVQVTILNCQTGATVATFPAMNTFMQGGTMQEFSAGAGFLRGPGHGVWSYESGNRFSFAFQFFRFNADGSLAGVTRGRRQVEVSRFRNRYTATVSVEIYNPAGIQVGTACGTETAMRFE